ncbi:hypothetical protein [Catenulispora rubra]|uniref:hypothetical protein n=1 Tax=Catenulispora rubra TaxID=280293 RepID=UPI0018925995|nr:hypothetical protein [Catenulispora rubra]
MSGGQEDRGGQGEHSDSEHSEGLERRYRRLLRILPKPYREARAEELLSVLMETSAQRRRWPEVREALRAVIKEWLTERGGRPPVPIG